MNVYVKSILDRPAREIPTGSLFGGPETCVAPFGECACQECANRNARYGLGLFEGGEMIRTDVIDVVLDHFGLTPVYDSDTEY